jgi:hypothetical protein
MVLMVFHAVGCGAAWRSRYGTPEVCWLNDEDGTIWGFVAPAIAVLAINFFLFVVIIRAILHVGLQGDQQRIAKVKRG